MKPSWTIPDRTYPAERLTATHRHFTILIISSTKSSAVPFDRDASRARLRPLEYPPSWSPPPPPSGRDRGPTKPRGTLATGGE